jgi:hypothetical protein
VRVFSTACDSASITSIVSKWGPFNFMFNRGNRKMWWMEDDSHVASGSSFPGEKGSVILCVVVKLQQVLLSPKFGSKSSHIFTQSPLNFTVVCGIDCLTCQGEFFKNNSLAKENDEHALDFTLQLSHLFLVLLSLDMSFKHPCRAHAFFTERLSNQRQSLRRTVSEICTKCDAVPLSDPSRNGVRPDTRLQIRGLKNSARPPSCVKFCTLSPKIC